MGGRGGAIFVPGRGGPDNGRFCAQLSLTMKEHTKAKKPRHAPELVCFTTDWWQKKKKEEEKRKRKKRGRKKKKIATATVVAVLLLLFFRFFLRVLTINSGWQIHSLSLARARAHTHTRDTSDTAALAHNSHLISVHNLNQEHGETETDS